jgi:hypothetical protein
MEKTTILSRRTVMKGSSIATEVAPFNILPSRSLADCTKARAASAFEKYPATRKFKNYRRIPVEGRISEDRYIGAI